MYLILHNKINISQTKAHHKLKAPIRSNRKPHYYSIIYYEIGKISSIRKPFIILNKIVMNHRVYYSSLTIIMSLQ